MAWQELLIALSLVMVIEGIWPFLSPRGFRKSLETVSQLDARTVRLGGLASMVIGVVMLYVVK